MGTLREAARDRDWHGIVRFALRFPYTFYVLAALIYPSISLTSLRKLVVLNQRLQTFLYKVA